MQKKQKKKMIIERIEDALLNLITFGMDPEIRMKSIDYLINNQTLVPPSIQVQLRTLQYGTLSQQALRSLVISLLLQLDISRTLDYLIKILLNPRETHAIKNTILDALLQNPQSEFIDALLEFIHQRSNHSDLRAKAIWLVIYTNTSVGSNLIQDLIESNHDDLLIQKTAIQASGFLLDEKLINPLFSYLKQANPMISYCAIKSLLKYPSESIFFKTLKEYKQSSSTYHQNLLKLIHQLDIIHYLKRVEQSDVPILCELISQQKQSHLQTLEFIEFNTTDLALKQSLKVFIDDNLRKISNSAGFEFLL